MSRLDGGPELWGVVCFAEVGEFVDEDVVDEARRELERGPVDVDALRAVGGPGRAPPEAEIANVDGHGVLTEAGRPGGGSCVGATDRRRRCTSGASRRHLVVGLGWRP